MQKPHLIAAFLLCAAITACLRADNPSPVPSDKEQLQGTWKIVHRQKNGQPEETGQGAAMKFTGDTITQSTDGNASEGTFTLDPTTNPKQITMTGATGEHAGAVFNAIYELKGDALKIAYSTAQNAKARPKDFACGEGEGLLVLERMK